MPQFWTGPTGKEIRKLGRDAQVIALYLMTCPSSNMIGLYYLALPTLCHETGIEVEGACKSLQSLRDIKFALYDDSEEVVFVPNMAKYQLGENLKLKDHRHKHVATEIAKYSKSIFFSQFMEFYGKAYCLVGAVNRLLKDEAPSEALTRGEGHHREEQEQEQEQEQEKRGLPSLAENAGRETPGTSAERLAALEAFERWCFASEGHGISVENNDHKKIFDLMADLAQSAPVIRGRDSVPAHLLVATAADQFKAERKEFKHMKFACSCVKGRIGDWKSKGFSVNGKNGNSPVNKPLDKARVDKV